MRYRIACPPDELDGEYYGQTLCSGTIRVQEATGARRLLATGAFRRGYWSRHVVDLRLTALGRRLLSRNRGVRATVRLGMRVISEGDAESGRWRLRWAIQLKSPR